MSASPKLVDLKLYSQYPAACLIPKVHSKGCQGLSLVAQECFFCLFVVCKSSIMSG